MKNSTVLLWWFLYQLVGILAAMGFGFVAGLIAGIFSLPELIAMPIILIGALTTNFFVFKWSVSKIAES
tara:strand:- start:180 stop:386 length:207 start_codon:yes stop_codon:yes gene_type:complete